MMKNKPLTKVQKKYIDRMLNTKVKAKEELDNRLKKRITKNTSNISKIKSVLMVVENLLRQINCEYSNHSCGCGR